MYWSKSQVIILIVFAIILASIPLSAVLLKQTQIFKSRASEEITKNTSQKITSKVATSSATPTPSYNAIPSTSPLSELSALLESSGETASTANLTPTPTPEAVANLAFGPTLNLSISIEGRPVGKNGGKVFIGLSSGAPTTHPTYVLTFTVDFPDSGKFSGISLAGLNPGSNYTAYIKGPAQIDTAVSFAMGPTETILNSSQPISLLTGDLNEDNVINPTDYDIAKNLYGLTPSSKGWNARADLNLDGVINNFDLNIINKNLGKTGASGTWLSSPLKSATPTPGSGGPVGGYWLYVP